MFYLQNTFFIYPETGIGSGIPPGLVWSGPRGTIFAPPEALVHNFFGFKKKKRVFLAYLIAPGVPGPLKSNSASKNTPRDLSTASDRRIFIDWTVFCL